RARGLVARVYKGGLDGGLDSPDDFARALAAGAGLLATDRVNDGFFSWATTRTPNGGAFRCPGCDGRKKPLPVVALRAESGDLAGEADSFFFAYALEDGASTWSTFVSVPSSHVDPDAKGCLEARASRAASAAHVALCRSFAERGPVLLVRDADGHDTLR